MTRRRPSDETHLTRAGYARHRGISPSAVTRGIKRGDILLTDDGRYVRVAASDARMDRVRALAVGRPPGGSRKPAASAGPRTVADVLEDVAREDTAQAKADLERERAAHERVKRERAELELAKARGEVVGTEAVASAWFSALRQIRNGARALPARLAARVAAEGDPHKVRQILRAEVDGFLSTIAEAVPGLADGVEPGDLEAEG